MKGWHAPKLTKDDVRRLLSKEDYKEILTLMGYKLIPKSYQRKLDENAQRFIYWK